MDTEVVDSQEFFSVKQEIHYIEDLKVESSECNIHVKIESTAVPALQACTNSTKVELKPVISAPEAIKSPLDNQESNCVEFIKVEHTKPDSDDSSKLKLSPPVKQTRKSKRLASEQDKEEIKYKCEHCEYTTKWKYNLASHDAAKHGIARPYKCTSCDYTAATLQNLNRHVNTKHNPNASLHKCKECNYATKDRQNLRRHSKVCHNGDVEQYKCLLCDHVADWLGNLSEHVKTSHKLPTAPYSCGECEYTSKDKCQMIVHMQEHKADEVYKCGQCKFKTRHKKGMLRHTSLKHDSGAAVHRCPSCSYKTCQVHLLERHLKRQHSGKREIQVCEVCGFTSYYKKTLMDHLERYHNVEEGLETEEHDVKHCVDVFKCAQCDFSCVAKIDLVRHIQKHRPVKMYECCECAYSTEYRSNLIKHMRNHTRD